MTRVHQLNGLEMTTNFIKYGMPGWNETLCQRQENFLLLILEKNVFLKETFTF